MKRLRQKATAGSFDRLYKEVILPLFETITDKRAKNTHYPLLLALKCGFAIYSLKMTSLFAGRKYTQTEQNNLKTVYGIEQRPTDSGLRKILDALNPATLRVGFHQLFQRLRQLGILKDYRYWRSHMVVSVDGVQHFSSQKITCPHCLKRQHKDGSCSYYHSMLSAAIVHLDKKAVFVLDNEPIIQQDGATKNDCEQNAAKRLFQAFGDKYAKECLVFVLDALYATGPMLRLIGAKTTWKYVVNVKPSGQKSLFRQFEARQKRGQVQSYSYEDAIGHHQFTYVKQLALNNSSTDVRVNLLYYEFRDKKGTVHHFSWVTNIPLRKSNVYKVMRMGRSRWKIENETFNTLKNQGYHFKRNFGHGHQHLCTIWAYLMMLAFCVDQIQQYSCHYFQRLWQALATKSKLWAAIRGTFEFVPCQNMKQLFENIAKAYQIQLE